MQDWEGPELDAWDAWTPWEAAERFAHIDVPWCVVAGWSIDLFIGKQTREHGDLEVEFLSRDFDVKILKQLGCAEIRQKGSHLRVQCGTCKRTIPIHPGDIAPGTLRAIKRQLAPCLGEDRLP